jgi:hypothetical protein
MNTLRWVSLIGVVGLMGCALFMAKETLYLRTAKDRATQEEVRQQLGPPVMTQSAPAGESVWVYQVRELQPGNRVTAPGMWCDEYVLTFDSQTILRQWTHRSYFHGGETVPKYCVPDGFSARS